jgi:UDP-2,3-diacylglucosamine pyrophosphatase LpxH
MAGAEIAGARPSERQAAMSDVAESLSRALTGPNTIALPLPLELPHRIVVLSDQHKGAADGADEFNRCKPAYLAALRHYIDQGFTAVFLGDVEELWEQGFDDVVRAHRDVLELEGAFPPSRYYRLWGNHDDRWMRHNKVRKELGRFLPTAAVYEAIRFAVTKDGQPLGTLFMLHGHQGSGLSDQWSWFSRVWLPFYRILQRTFGIGKTTPAKDACLRGKHDKEMYRWAASQEKVILVAGHTHRPVWSSRTHLQKLEMELARLRERADSEELADEIAALERQVEERRAKSPPCEDELGTASVYFNTGCCKFEDGDITGVELLDGELRLVKWWSEPGPAGPIVLERGRLEDFFARLPGA